MQRNISRKRRQKTSQIAIFGVVLSLTLLATLLHNNELLIKEHTANEIVAVEKAITHNLTELDHTFDSVAAFMLASNSLSKESFSKFVSSHSHEVESTLVGFGFLKLRNGISKKDTFSLSGERRRIFNLSATLMNTKRLLDYSFVSESHYDRVSSVEFLKSPEFRRTIFKSLMSQETMISGLVSSSAFKKSENSTQQSMLMAKSHFGKQEGILLANIDAIELLSAIKEETGIVSQFSVALGDTPDKPFFETKDFNAQHLAGFEIARSSFDFGGQNWVVSVRPCVPSTYLSPTELLFPYIAGLVGLLLTSLASMGYLGLSVSEQIFKRKAEASAQDYAVANKKLEISNKEVRETNAALQVSLEQQEKLNASLNRFAAITAHDLSAPLKRVGAMINIVLDNHSSSVATEDKDILERASRSVTSLNKMVQSLLTYSSTGLDPEKSQHLCLHEVVESVLQVMAIPDLENMVESSFNTCHKVNGDSELLSHVFKNLISNGLKFNQSPDKKIYIETRPGADGTIEILFTDNGIGISDDQAEKIFELFTRLHNESKYPGHGIGLAICYRIVSDHGGEIFVDTTVDQGTRMVVRLPDVKQKEAELAA